MFKTLMLTSFKKPNNRYVTSSYQVEMSIEIDFKSILLISIECGRIDLGELDLHAGMSEGLMLKHAQNYRDIRIQAASRFQKNAPAQKLLSGM